MRIPALSIASLLAFATLAQQHDCAAHRITQQRLQAMGLSTDIREHLPGALPKGGGNPVIPVVVHVVWNTAAENIPDATITAMIAQMNFDYSEQNSDVTSVRAAFAGVVTNTGIQFCLASIDPNGNATTGIVRKNTTETWFDPDTETNDMKYNPQGDPSWDPDSYLNIWVCDISSGQTGGGVTTGYAYLPVGGIVGTGDDGLVLDFDYGFNAGARTATHETGHYLGLQHPWGDNGGCVDDDGFTDTPDTDGPTFSCFPTNQTSCGVLTQYENFMDYADCSLMFTDDQGAYMNGIVAGVRSSLLASNGCGSIGSGPCIPTSTSGTSDGDYVSGVELNTLSNTGTGGTGTPTYVDYTALNTSLQRGNTYTIDVTSGAYNQDIIGAWIDFDGNDVFGAGEELGNGVTSTAFQTLSFTFTVPANAALGGTVLRARCVYPGTGQITTADPCYNFAYGETEDYSVIITPSQTSLCIPTSVNGTNDGDFVNGVELNTIVNNSSGSTGGPTYVDYTGQSTQLGRGSSYDLLVQSGDYQPDMMAAWIDYDGDDQLETGEMLGELVTTAIYQTWLIPFTVPNNAVLGATTLRVRCMYPDTGEPTSADPCFDFSWGETEDYTVVIDLSTGTVGPQGPGSVMVRYADDHILINWPTSKAGSLRLVDITGREALLTDAPNGTYVLEQGSLASGTYAVDIVTGTGRYVGRLIVP
ncbi:MAG: GEVED domain-containing protein [Flavobacteriales bacterium]